MAISSPQCCVQGHSEENFKFGDARLDRRGNRVAGGMAKGMGKSLSGMFCNKADLQGLYRFFDNDLVTPEKILSPHQEQTINRCKQEDLVSCVQDSSDLDYDYLTCIEGFCSMHPGVDRGFRIHPSLVINASGVPLGVFGTTNYTREKDADQKKHRNSLSIEEKESYRWLLGYRLACDLARNLPDTTVVSIADREGDIYECLLEAQDASVGHKAYLLVRADHNRNLMDSSDETQSKLRKKLIRSSVAYQAKVSLNPHRSNARTADVNVRACQVGIQSPRTCKKKSWPSVAMNAVLVSEVDPPKGGEPLEWLLLTTLPIDTPEEIQRIVTLYGQRWQIEVFFKVLKSGCGIDSPHLQTKERIENFIAMSLIVAWRVMLTTYLPRRFPNELCTLLFTEQEWKLAYLGAYSKPRPLPETTPTLKEMTSLVAMLGGYQKRKAPPGIQTVWRGIIRLMDMVRGYELMHAVKTRPNLVSR